MGQDRKEADSVYDFLYIDSKRIALFLSQFGNYGHLTALTKTSTDTKTVDGKVDIKLASMGSHETGQTGLSKQYDAQWVAPLTFLDEAAARNMIERDISAAGFGNLVLASGQLEVRDLRMIIKAFNLPSMKALLQSTNQEPPVGDHRDRRERRRDRHSKQDAPMRESAEQAFGTDFMTLLPHGTQAILRGQRDHVWCGLKEDCLITSTSELFLNHGVKIPGRWNILGILDARPDDVAGPPEQQFEAAKSAMPNDSSGLFTLVTQGFGGFIDGIAPLARMMLGRNSTSYGITPLLIFREITRTS